MNYKVMLLVVSLVLTLVAQCVFTYLDLRYREIKRRFILLAYIPSLVGGFLINSSLTSFIFGALWLFLVFYFIEVILGSKNSIVGTVDIIGAPIYTVWFGFATVPFMFILVLLLLLTKAKPVYSLLNKVCLNKEVIDGYHSRVPLLPLFQVDCLILLAIKFLIFPLI